MTIAGTYPEKGVRFALNLKNVDDALARYEGAALTPLARHAVELAIDVKTGTATVQLGDALVREGASADAPPALEAGDVAFIRQLGKQLWRLAVETSAEAGGGTWPRRIQRWRGPK